jgi:hypothetical protein
MKIQNKYVFKKYYKWIPIFKKKRMGLAWLPGTGAWACQTETLGSGMFVKPKYLAYGMAQVPWV